MKYRGIEAKIEMLSETKIFRGVLDVPADKVTFYGSDYEAFEKEFKRAVDHWKSRARDKYKIRTSNRNRAFMASNIKTKETRIFQNQSEAARELKIAKQAISVCLMGTQKSAKGYSFRYLQ